MLNVDDSVTARLPERVRIPSPGDPDALPKAVVALADIAKSVNGARRLDDVLGQVVYTTRELLSADRATILLIDDSGELVPAVSSARAADQGLYSRFRSMRPIRVQIDGAQREVLAAGRAIAIDDAHTSAIVPDEWRETFALQSLALVPLGTDGEPCGVLVVDSERPHRFGLNELAALEGIAASTSTAVRAARDLAAATTRAERLSRTLAVTSSLNATPSPDRVLDLALGCFYDIFQARSCSLSVLDPGRISFTTLCSRGPDQPPRGRHLLEDVSTGHLEGLRAEWAADASRPFVYDVDAARETKFPAPDRGVLLPLAQEHRVRGFALVAPGPDVALTAELLELARSVAGQVWLALERARLTSDLERRLVHAELLRNLSDTLAELPEMRVAVERLAPTIREVAGCELLEVLLSDQLAARVFSANRLTAAQRESLRAWQREGASAPRLTDGVLVVPMTLEGSVVGALRLRPVEATVPDDQPMTFLLALATGVAEVVARAVLRERVTRNDRDLAVARERDRLTQDLHQSVERQLAGAAGALQVAGRQPAQPNLRRAVDTAADLVIAARREVHDAVSSLSSFRRFKGRGLVPTAREMGRALAVGTDAAVDVKVVGTPYSLSPEQETALLRVLHEALTNVERHARASVVVVCLRFDDREVRLSVRDNGVGLGQRTGVVGGAHSGLRMIQKRVAAVGGTVTLAGEGPHGVRVEAIVPNGL